MKEIEEMTTDELREMVNLMIPELSRGVEDNMRQLDILIRDREIETIRMVKDIMVSNMQFLIICMMARIGDRHCEEK